MKKEITITEIIEMLKKVPKTSKIIIDTKNDVEVVGFVIKRQDGSKQLADLIDTK